MSIGVTITDAHLSPGPISPVTGERMWDEPAPQPAPDVEPEPLVEVWASETIVEYDPGQRSIIVLNGPADGKPGDVGHFSASIAERLIEECRVVRANCNDRGA